MKLFKHEFYFFLVLLLGVIPFVAASENTIDTTSALQKNLDILTIGAILPLTGEFEKDGQSALKGLELAREHLRNRKDKPLHVVLKIKDNKGDSSITAKLARELILQDHVQIVLGPLHETNIREALKVTEEYRTPLAVPTSLPLKNISTQYLLAPLASEGKSIERLLNFVVTELKRRELGLIVDQGSALSVLQAQYFKEAAQKANIKIHLEQQYLSGTTDLQPLIENFKKQQVDTVFMPGTGEDMARLAKLVSEQNLMWMFLGSSMFNEETFFKEPGKHLIGHYFYLLYHSSVEGLNNKQFVENFEAKEKTKPSLFAGVFYDFLNAVAEAHISLGIKNSSVALKDFLVRKSSYSGTTGLLNFDLNKRDQNPTIIMETQSERARAKVVIF